jgi:hypothetical protein
MLFKVIWGSFGHPKRYLKACKGGGGGWGGWGGGGEGMFSPMSELKVKPLTKSLGPIF